MDFLNPFLSWLTLPSNGRQQKDKSCSRSTTIPIILPILLFPQTWPFLSFLKQKKYRRRRLRNVSLQSHRPLSLCSVSLHHCLSLPEYLSPSSAALLFVDFLFFCPSLSSTRQKVISVIVGRIGEQGSSCFRTNFYPVNQKNPLGKKELNKKELSPPSQWVGAGRLLMVRVSQRVNGKLDFATQLPRQMILFARPTYKGQTVGH